jgi:hypothetical protein
MDLAQSTKLNPSQMVTPDFSKINLNAPQEFVKNQLGIQQLGQGIAANKAVSDAIQQSTDEFGNTNVPKVMQLISQNPDAAYNLPQIGKQLQDMQSAKFGAMNAQIDNVRKQNDYWNGRLGGLLQKGEKITKNDLIGELVNAVNRGVISVEQAKQELGNLPSEDKDLFSYVKQHHFATLENTKQLEMRLPSKEVLNPITKQKELVSPAELMGYTTPNTQLQTESGRFVTGFSPSEQSAQTTTGTNQANAVQELHNNVSTAPTRINILESARANLDNLNLTTGPGVEGRNQIKSFFNALAPAYTEKVFGKDFNGNIKDTDEFKKYMASYTNAASANLGSGTDARLNAAIAGNANINMNKMANQDIITKTIAIEKMNQAQDYAWNKSGVSPDKFNSWQAEFNKNVKPEVFAFDSMTSKQQKDFIERKTKDGSLGAFKKDLVNMVQQGLIEPPGR